MSLRQWSWKAIAARSLDNGDLGGHAGGEVDHSRAVELDIRYGWMPLPTASSRWTTTLAVGCSIR